MGIRMSLVSLSAAAALLLSGCSAAAPSEPEAQPGALAQISELGIHETDARSIIDGLDTLPVADRPAPEALIASVQPDQLVLQPGDVAIPLADDEFYLSIAPYTTQTHPCDFHSLTTCLGELQNTPIELTVTDVESGEEVVSEITATADNGFVGVWLTRDREFDVRIVSEGGAAEQRVSTGVQDPTCLTTMQLRS